MFLTQGQSLHPIGCSYRSQHSVMCLDVGLAMTQLRSFPESSPIRGLLEPDPNHKRVTVVAMFLPRPCLSYSIQMLDFHDRVKTQDNRHERGWRDGSWSPAFILSCSQGPITTAIGNSIPLGSVGTCTHEHLLIHTQLLPETLHLFPVTQSQNNYTETIY